MTKKEILNGIDSLCKDIDSCTWDIVKAKKDKDIEAVNTAHYKMEGLMVSAHQELSFLRDLIDSLDAECEELYWNEKDKRIVLEF